MPQDRVSARVGPLSFDPDFSHPVVDVDREARVVEHETIGDDFVVQTMGRKPDKIAIQGVIYDFQREDAYDILEAGEITVRTDTWSGKAVAKTVTTDYRREADPEHGIWVYDVAMDLVEVNRNEAMSDGQEEQKSRSRGGFHVGPEYFER